MKTEHRHELNTNELSKVTVEVESYFERHATTLQWGLIGVALIAAIGIFYWRTTAAVESAAWNEFAQANTAKEFAQVSADYSTSKAAPWAKLREANEYLKTGLFSAFENREKANTDLNKAKAILTDLSKAGGPRELRQQVLFALARSIEMTSDGDLKPAITAYETLIKEIPDTVFKEEAERRIKDLQTNDAKEFYAFFSKQNPKPAEPPKPNDGKGVKDPMTPLSSGLKDLKEGLLRSSGTDSDTPLLSPPGLPDTTGAEEGKAVEEKAPATEDAAQPSADPEKKADEPAAKEPEKTEAPAAETKPVETAPEKKAE